MLSLITGILLIIWVISFIIIDKTIDIRPMIILVLTLITGVALIIWFIAFIEYHSEAETYPRKIAQYEEYIENLDEYLSSLVEEYKNYELNTYNDFFNKENITTLSVDAIVKEYPNLKYSDALNTYMEIYYKMTDKLQALKQEYLNYKNLRWWLYGTSMDD